MKKKITALVLSAFMLTVVITGIIPLLSNRHDGDEQRINAIALLSALAASDCNPEDILTYDLSETDAYITDPNSIEAEYSYDEGAEFGTVSIKVPEKFRDETKTLLIIKPINGGLEADISNILLSDIAAVEQETEITSVPMPVYDKLSDSGIYVVIMGGDEGAIYEGTFVVDVTEEETPTPEIAYATPTPEAAESASPEPTSEPTGSETTASPTPEVTDVPLTPTPEVTDVPPTQTPEVTDVPLMPIPEVIPTPKVTDAPPTQTPKVTDIPLTPTPEATDASPSPTPVVAYEPSPSPDVTLPFIEVLSDSVSATDGVLGGKISAVLRGTDEEAKLILAVYDKDGKLKGVQIKDSAENGIAYDINITGVTDVYRYSIFAWKDLESQEPVCVPYVKR